MKPELSQAGTLLDAELSANKLNTSFLSEISTTNILKAIQQSEKLPRAGITNGATIWLIM